MKVLRIWPVLLRDVQNLDRWWYRPGVGLVEHLALFESRRREVHLILVVVRLLRVIILQ